MRSLVTGGAGFIGSHLVERLVNDGHEVIVLDNFKRGNKLNKKIIEQISLIEGDVRDNDIVIRTSNRCDYIFHFAAVLGVDIVADNPMETMETEIIGLQNIVHAAIINSSEKIVYASTSGVYGKAAIEKAVEEDFLVYPSTSYSIAKRYNEIYLGSVFKEKIFSSISLRLFNVYGPKQDNRMVIPRFFEQAIQGESLTVFGTGNQTRDFTYIDDITEVCIRVAKDVKGCQILNVANNRETSIKELADKIIKITGSESKITFINSPSDRYDFEVQRRYGSSEKLKSLIGFYPNTDIDIGLQKVFEYYRNTIL